MENNLGKKVKELRIQNNLTQAQVAKALDVTPGYISNVENNRSMMTLKMLIFYAKLTGQSLDYLAGCIDDDYFSTSLDTQILTILREFPPEKREKVIRSLQKLKDF